MTILDDAPGRELDSEDSSDWIEDEADADRAEGAAASNAHPVLSGGGVANALAVFEGPRENERDRPGTDWEASAIAAWIEWRACALQTEDTLNQQIITEFCQRRGIPHVPVVIAWMTLRLAMQTEADVPNDAPGSLVSTVRPLHAIDPVVDAREYLAVLLDVIEFRGGKTDQRHLNETGLAAILNSGLWTFAELRALIVGTGVADDTIDRVLLGLILGGWDPLWQFTDLGNARRLLAFHGKDFRHCPVLGWLRWDGRRWRGDDDGELMRRAKQTAESIVDDGKVIDKLRRLAKDEDDEKFVTIRAQQHIRFGEISQSAGKLQAIVTVTQTEPGVAIRVEDLDTDPWRLNAGNGTIDLTTGELLPHDRADYITKLTPVDYDPAARHPFWDDFLAAATGGDVELAEYLRRAVGYSVTGSTAEEVFFLLAGPGASGKSTFIEAVKATLGDYAATADFDTFLKRRDSGGPRNDIARLAGARVVISIEVDEGKELAQGLVKTVTGGDTVTARFLYREHFEFEPRFKLFLVANHVPHVDDADDAMWRRIQVIAFEHVVPVEERDPKMKATLKNPNVAGPAILAWMVRGCEEYLQEGLGMPPAVRDAIERYREAMDPIAEFIDERCILHPTVEVASGDLHAIYRSWADLNGHYPILSQAALAPKLKKRGCQRRKGSGGRRMWVGIALRARDVENSYSDWGNATGATSPALAPPAKALVSGGEVADVAEVAQEEGSF